MKTFKILGLLLTYPDEATISAYDELARILKEEALLPKKALVAIQGLMSDNSSRDIMAVQEEYVETFDRGSAHCLNLFEHIHGESRDRGQAMVDLSETYAEKGLYISERELPDFLPLFMEYLSLCPIEEATEVLGDAVEVIATIGTKLKKRDSYYYAVFNALELLSAIKPDKHRIEEAVKNAPQDPETLDELDEEWEEKPAFGGNPEGDCGDCNAFPKATENLQRMVGGTE